MQYATQTIARIRRRAARTNSPILSKLADEMAAGLFKWGLVREE